MRTLCGTILAVSVVAVGVGVGCVEKSTTDFALVKGGKAVAAFEFGAVPGEKAKTAARSSARRGASICSSSSRCRAPTPLRFPECRGK